MAGRLPTVAYPWLETGVKPALNSRTVACVETMHAVLCGRSLLGVSPLVFMEPQAGKRWERC